MAKEYDVIVIGSGPAGYVSAIRATQLGLTTACVEKWVDDENNTVLGGTCLNVGCIPSKALLDSSQKYIDAKEEFHTHGIKASKVSIDIPSMMERKTKVVTQLTQGIKGLFAANKVDSLNGIGTISGNNEVSVLDAKGNSKKYLAKNIIIATGSVPINIPPAPVDNEVIVDSTGALEFDAVPERLGIIGAGVIGLELGSVWGRLGAQVTVLEALDEFLPSVDSQIAREAKKILGKQGLDIKLGSKVTGHKISKGKKREVTVTFEAKDSSEEITVDKLIVAVGRRPVTDSVLTNNVSIDLCDRGFIKVNEQCQTNIPNIYAVGDVVRGPMLAHKGSEEGVMVAERLADKKTQVNYDLVPSVIYTHPEVASIGKTEEELKELGIAYSKGSFPLSANSRAKAVNDTEGLVKILADAKTDKVLGVHIIGPHAGEMIAEMSIAMEFGASSEDIARTCHAHPTFSEAIKEAALSVDKRQIHS